MHRDNCIICGSNQQAAVMDVIDFGVSGETFTICKCLNCDFHFTNPVPDKTEIGRYYKSENYVSHTSSKKGIINKLYHLVRNYSLKKKVRLINRLNNNETGVLMDYGAGTGHFIAKAIEGGWAGFGLELDDSVRITAEKLNQVHLRPIEELFTIDNSSVDIVTMWHVLEHVHDIDDTLKKVAEVLKTTGKFVIAVPNRNSYDAKYYKQYWAAYDVPIHLYHFVEKDLVLLLTKFGFRLREVLPMKFDSFYVSMLSEKYKRGNIIKAFFIGLWSNLKAKNNNYSSKIYIFELEN